MNQPRGNRPNRNDRPNRDRNDRNQRNDRSARRAPERPADWVEEQQLEGRNAVLEALRAGRPLDQVFIASGDTDAALSRIAAMAREAGAVLVSCDRHRLDQLAEGRAHQGVVAIAAAHEYATL